MYLLLIVDWESYYATIFARYYGVVIFFIGLIFDFKWWFEATVNYVLYDDLEW